MVQVAHGAAESLKQGRSDSGLVVTGILRGHFVLKYVMATKPLNIKNKNIPTREESPAPLPLSEARSPSIIADLNGIDAAVQEPAPVRTSCEFAEDDKGGAHEDEFVTDVARQATAPDVEALVARLGRRDKEAHWIAAEIGEMLIAHRGDAAFMIGTGITAKSIRTQHMCVCRAMKRAAFAMGVTGSILAIKEAVGFPSVYLHLTREGIACHGRVGYGLAPNKGARRPRASAPPLAGPRSLAPVGDATDVAPPCSESRDECDTAVAVHTLTPTLVVRREAGDPGPYWAAIERAARPRFLRAYHRGVRDAEAAGVALPIAEQALMLERGETALLIELATIRHERACLLGAVAAMIGAVPVAAIPQQVVSSAARPR